MTSTNWGALRQQAEDATKALPKGEYNVEVTKAEAVKASTGSDMIRTTLTVVDGPHKGRTLWTNFVLTPDKAFAMNLFFKNMAGFGLGDDFFQQLQAGGAPLESDLATIANTLVGRRARGSVDIRMYQGQERNEINGFVQIAGSDPLGGGGGAPAVPVVGTPGGGSSTPPVPNISSPAPTTPTVGTTPGQPPELVF